jgi:hypothetical protein
MEAARIRRRYMNFLYILKRAFNLWLAKKEKQLEQEVKGFISNKPA